MSPIVPSIVICIPEGFKGGQILREATRGVEEESIPYEVLTHTAGDAVSLAYAGAEKSVLEVGIGIDDQSLLAVHYRKLPALRPLYSMDYSKDFREIRTVCANAARLVKNTPFKDTKGGKE